MYNCNDQSCLHNFLRSSNILSFIFLHIPTCVHWVILSMNSQNESGGWQPRYVGHMTSSKCLKIYFGHVDQSNGLHCKKLFAWKSPPLIRGRGGTFLDRLYRYVSPKGTFSSCFGHKYGIKFGSFSQKGYCFGALAMNWIYLLEATFSS